MKKIPCLCYTRIVGYYSPLQTNWNKGKKEEFKDRKEVSLEKFFNRLHR